MILLQHFFTVSVKAITRRRRDTLADGRDGKFLQDGYWVLFEGDNTEYPLAHSECGNLKNLIKKFIATGKHLDVISALATNNSEE